MFQGKVTSIIVVPLLSAFFLFVFNLGTSYGQDFNDHKNLYLSGFLGLNFLEDADNTSPGFADINTEFDSGFGTGGALGFDWGNFRTEFEIAYRKNTIDELQTLGTPVPSTGDFTALSYLLNVFYDFENSSLITPYIGAGFGFATINANNVVGTGVINTDDDDTEFAYKLALGAAYQLTPAIDLLADYSFFGTSDPEFTNSVTGAELDSEFLSHSLSLGIRFRF
jgi:OOP family OmpA-OmpF porin